MYVAAIAVALAALDVVTRTVGTPSRTWYPLIERSAPRKVRVLFAGSSRVQAAVDIERITAALPAERDRIDINLGQGFSTVIEHALGLRRLADQGLLNGATVFLEASGGMPDDSRWTGRWYYLEMPDFLLTVMQTRDLPRFWRSGMTREEKIAGTMRGAFGDSGVFTYHELMRVKFLTWIDHQYVGLSRAFAPRRAAPAAPTPAAAALREAGGVRTDLDDRERIRAEAVAEGRRMLRAQQIVTDWDGRVIGTIVDIVRRGGGTVIFFETPLSPAMRLASDTPTGLEDRRRFEAQVHQWGARMIPLSHSYDADAFPDGWHLSLSASSVFTGELLAAWQGR